MVVFVDKLSKMVHIVPTTVTLTAPQLAVMFFKEVVRLHGIPTAIISDRDTKLLSRNYYWPNMKETVNQYVTSCVLCQQNKTSRTLQSGLLQPIAIPSRPWEVVSLDFVVQLPTTNNQTRS